MRWPSRCQDSGWAVDSSIGCCRKPLTSLLVVQRGVHQRVGPGLVGADVDQVLRRLAGREDPAERGRGVEVRPGIDLAGHSGHGAEHVHGGEVPGDGKLAVQDHVAVQDGAGGVGDGLVVVVAVHQHGVNAGDGAGFGRAGALQQPGQDGEGRRRVAAGGRGLAGGEADLALRHGHAGEGVHHQDHVLALVAEGLGDPGGGERRAHAHEGGFVGGGDHHDGARQAGGAEVVLEELADFAAAFADEGDHGDLGVGAAGDHREQGGLADAGAGEQAHALALAERGHGVQDAHAGLQRGVDAGAFHGVGCLVVDRHAGSAAAAGPCRRSGVPGRRGPGRTGRARWGPAPRRPWRGPGSPAATPASRPSGMQRTEPSRAATTSASRPGFSPTVTRSPSAQSSPDTSRPSPMTEVTTPTRCGAAAASAAA